MKQDISIFSHQRAFVVPSYAAGFQIAHLSKICDKACGDNACAKGDGGSAVGLKRRFYTLDGRHEHDGHEANSYLFVPQKIENIVDEVEVLQYQEDYSIPPVIVHELHEIVAQIKEHKNKMVYIAADDEEFIVHMLAASRVRCNYILQDAFFQTEEGMAWQLLFQLRNKPYESRLLKQICMLAKIHDKQIMNNVFPYVHHSPLHNHALVKEIESCVAVNNWPKLFKHIFNRDCQWNPDINHEENMQFLNQAILVKRNIEHDCDCWIIDKSLAPYFDNVISIGAAPVAGAKLHIIHDTSYIKHDNFSSTLVSTFGTKTAAIQINTLKEQKLALQGKIGQLLASNLGVLEHEHSLHAYIKNCVIEEIKARLNDIKNYDESWKNWLMKSGLEHIKILQKAKLLYETFFEWQQKHAFEIQEWGKKIDTEHGSVYCDLYATCQAQGIAQHVVVKFFWNTPSQAGIYREDASFAALSQNEDISQIFLMTPGKVIELELKNFDQQAIINKGELVTDSCLKHTITREDDLFYWRR